MTAQAARAYGGPAAGSSGKITRDAVLAAALGIIDGADALPTRRLVRALVTRAPEGSRELAR
jgi:hypothetical protein